MPGIDLDLDLGPIEIMAGLKAELATMNQHNAQALEYKRREIARTKVPLSVRQNVSATIPTPTQRTGMSFGGPQPGFYWLLRRLIVGGVTWKTVAAGTVEVYVTALAAGEGQAATGPIIAGLALSDMVDQLAAMPAKEFYSNEQVIIQENENLVVVVDTGTAAQQYVATCQVQVFRTVAGGIVFDG